jgi:GWxTD domain-containing protein
MKKLYILTALVILSLSGFSSPKILRAYLSYASFTLPGPQSTIETYLAVDGKSVVYKEIQPGNFRASIEITVIFKQADSISSFAKYELLSPMVQDTANVNFGFIDFQRYAMNDGLYKMEIQISDMNNPQQQPFSTQETIQLSFPDDVMGFSGIQWVDNYKKSENPSVITKNGLDIVPYVFNFYPADKNTLTFYTELYNASAQLGAESKFLISTYIQSYESRSKMNNKLTNKRVEAKEVNVILQSFDITDLPSGNYELVVEARDRENKIICSNTMFFQRSNPSIQYNLDDLSALNIENTFASRYIQIDTLREYLHTLDPLSTEFERDYAYNLTKTEDLLTMQRYLYNFWYKRNILEPESAWKNYCFEVKKADFSFHTQTKKGYQTDRGRVYLQYGAPDQIADQHNEPGAYPYEIWHYYQLGNQRDKKFVFCSKDIVTNDFLLIHSNAVGELSNYQWQNYIYGRTNSFDIDQTSPTDTWGSKATDYYNQPR